MELIFRYSILVILCCCQFVSFATHNRAGEITFEHIAGYTYQVTLLTYTYAPSSANEDRDFLTVFWGDDTGSEIPRVLIEPLPDDYQKNTYIAQHSFPGAGLYEIFMEDKNRNAGIDNINESVYIPFSIKTTLTINPFVGQNSTPLLLNPPIDKAVVGQRFVHNPAAFDREGDSLSYMLTKCTGSGGEVIESYTYPVASKEVYVDNLSGDLIWDAPVVAGKYNVAMVVVEWRKGIQISSVVRDIQIDVSESDNNPPVIELLEPICVTAGTTLEFKVVASDIDNDNVLLTAVGGPFVLSQSPASFQNGLGLGSVEGEFVWETTCDHIRQLPYTVIFKAIDDASIPLHGQLTLSIKVVGVPLEIKTISNEFDSVDLEFEDAFCPNAIKMQLYRSTQPIDLHTHSCPEILSDEYELILDTTSLISSYTDNNKGNGLSQGFKYCYRTITVYDNGAVSYPSTEQCVDLSNKSILLTNVSILSQAHDTSFVSIRWELPELIDTLKYPPPYLYRLYRNDCSNNDSLATLIYEKVGRDSVTVIDTVVSEDSQFCYSLIWYGSVNDDYVQLVRPLSASSLTLTGLGSDNMISLSFAAKTPWQNSVYVVYRKSVETSNWDSVGVTSTRFFDDTMVTNGLSYCYEVVSVGSYGLEEYPSDLHNSSNFVCVVPVDSIAPPIPVLKVDRQCTEFINKLSWSGDYHLDDLIFVIYYKSCLIDEFQVLDTVIGHLQYQHSFIDSVESMAGCYVVQSIDKNGNASEVSNEVCVYSCPSYVLPNMFTPNGDGINDLWEPVLNRFVYKIDLQVFNVWNEVVFSTHDPQIKWNGFDANGNPFTDGGYYYVCDVYERWLGCSLKPRTLIGYVYKFSDGQAAPK